MKTIIRKIKESKGFVSIEVVFIAGALILLASMVMFFFNGKAHDVSKTAGSTLDAVNKEMAGENDPAGTNP